jgi:serine protease Do
MTVFRILSVSSLAAGAALTAALALPAAPAQAQARRPFNDDALILRGPGSYIGASIRDLDTAAAERQNVPGGVVLEEVTPDGPAAQAGLREADIVVEFDGERVRSAQQFTRLVRETPPGRAVRAIVLRDGKRTDVTVTPQAGSGREFGIDSERIREQIERAMESVPTVRIEPRGARSLGAQVQELTPDLAAYFGAKDGVLVASVTADSAASRAGLRAGDVITAVNGSLVTSSADLLRRIRTAGDSQEVTLGIVRDRKESSVTVKLDASARQRPVRPLRPIRGAGV